MSQIATPFPNLAWDEGSTFLLPIVSLWRREIVRFYRQKSRVAGVILSPLVFWLVIGSGFGSSYRSGAGDQHYLQYFFPGALLMIVLFTSIFTMMSVIEDRDRGFLSSVLVAPVSRSVIVLGKVLGGATLSAVQGLIFLVFAPAVGAHFEFSSFVLIVVSVRALQWLWVDNIYGTRWLDIVGGAALALGLLSIALWCACVWLSDADDPEKS